MAALLDSETPVEGVTADGIRKEMRIIALPCHNNGKIRAEDLAITAGWGHAGQGGVTMPARGKVVERDYTEEEKTALAGNITTLGLSPEEAVACLGDTTFDIYLNDHTYWQNNNCGRP